LQDTPSAQPLINTVADLSAPVLPGPSLRPSGIAAQAQLPPVSVAATAEQQQSGQIFYVSHRKYVKSRPLCSQVPDDDLPVLSEAACPVENCSTSYGGGQGLLCLLQHLAAVHCEIPWLRCLKSVSNNRYYKMQAADLRIRQLLLNLIQGGNEPKPCPFCLSREITGSNIRRVLAVA
jgi:hypothetical protein